MRRTQTVPMTSTIDTSPVALTEADPEQVRRIAKIVARRSFCVLATTSAAGRSHAAGVVYDWADGALYVHTMRSSRKARNVAANSRVGIVIPARRLPVGPPFTVQFQADATVVAMNDPEIETLVAGRRLRRTSGHGALDEPDGCFLRITPGPTIHTYGIGVPVIAVAKDPLHSGARSTHWPSL